MTTAMDLDAATRVDGANGIYRTVLSDAWEVWGPNGGYIASIALRAASMLAEIRQPASLYCHFLSSPKFAEVDLQVEMLKKGRRSESLSVQMRQDGKPVLQALVRTAADAPGPEHQQLPMPNVPPPKNLKSYDELRPANDQSPTFKFWANLDTRPANQKWPGHSEPEPAIVRDWARFCPRACFDDPFVDAARSLILLDTYGWPAAWRAQKDGRYVAPNLDTSIWFHRLNPQSEWLLIDHSCAVGHRGLLGVQGNVWDTDGRLVATGSAHLCCLPQG